MKRIFQWSAEQLDCHSLSFVEIKYLRMKMISSRIERELKDFWEREQIEKLSSDFEHFLLEQLLLFDEQSRAVRRLIRNIRNHRVTSSELNVSPGFSLLGMIAFGVLSFFAAPLWLPFSLKATERSRNSMEAAIRYENSIRIAEYKSMPLVFMMAWCKEILHLDYSEDQIYQRLEYEYLQGFWQKVRHVCGKIVPQQIKADKFFIKNVANDSRTYKEIRNVYLPFCEHAKVIMGKLLIVYLEYFSHYAVATADSRRYSGARKWEGRFARVHEIEMLNEGKWVKAVVKTMVQPLKTDDSLIQLTEVDSLRNITHPNIIQIYGMSLETDDKSNRYLKLFMEQCPESLEDLVLRKRQIVPCRKVQNWNETESKKFYLNTMSGILAGLTHIHAEGYLHRDLKMSNVLVKNKVAKISDAGLLQLNGHTFTASCMPIPTTVAPEVFKNKCFDDAESDIYSIGILMWELYYCRPAFTSICQETSSVEQMEEYKPDVTDVTEFIGRIQKGLRPVFDKHQPVPKLVDLMTKCWSADMIKRPTANMVLIELENLI